MPILTVKSAGYTLDLTGTSRCHWLIGRALEGDICLQDPGVSRFHATVFRYHDRYCVVDHSLNGTHLSQRDESLSNATRLPNVSHFPSQTGPDPDDDNTKTANHDTAEIDLEDLPSEFRTPDSPGNALNKSHAAFRLQEINTRVPRMVGYAPHQYGTLDDIRPLLEMIYSADGADALSSMGRTLNAAIEITIIGTKQHILAFQE